MGIHFLLFSLSLAAFTLSGVQSTTFTITNNCPNTIWPATLTGGGRPPLSSTGFELPSKASDSIIAPAQWSGRFWARTGCSTDPTTGKFTCATGDCASGQLSCNGAGGAAPATLVELTLAANNGGPDFYDISLVDGFNLPVMLAPKGGCPATSCPADVNAVCPPELAVRRDGGVVACKSACLALNQPEYCCTGSHSSPSTCPPSNYSEIFKRQCPQAYSYAYDDKTSTFTCTGGADYIVTFCP